MRKPVNIGSVESVIGRAPLYERCEAEVLPTGHVLLRFFADGRDPAPAQEVILPNIAARALGEVLLGA